MHTNAPTPRDGTLQSGRSLEELKLELLRRVRAQLMPIAGVTEEDARAVIDSMQTLDRDQWATAWSARAELHRQAADAEMDRRTAREDWWQAWRLYHFARWPVENTSFKRHCYTQALAAYSRHAALLDPPVIPVDIPFSGSVAKAWLRLPTVTPAPLVIGISGLDSRKEDVMTLSDAYLRRGIALLAIDMPGTGEAPVALSENAHLLFSAVLDWVATREDLDAQRVVVQGRSWSGYWAALLAATEKERLRGCVMHGGPIHHYFQPEWLSPSLASPEYLYDYLPATAALFGVTQLDDLLAEAPRWSLQTRGLLDQPSAPMLLVNGARDTQIPIADVEWLAARNPRDTVWINPEGGHMGRSADWPGKRIFNEIIAPWIEDKLRA
jgi:esterase FrsA